MTKNQVVLFLLLLALIAVAATIMGIEIGYKVGGAKMTTVTVTTTTSASASAHPSLTLIGGSTCNKRTHQSFSYKLSNFQPGYATIFATYPDGKPITSLPNAGDVKISAYGTYTSPTVFKCWYGPNGIEYLPAREHYKIFAQDKTGQLTKALTFQVIG